ncbi:hypothetical protein TNCV_699771 [Trichonephila clavipes]|nr:hypothetical protein TNCV_699771 [Trichonephila clavipes]
MIQALFVTAAKGSWSRTLLRNGLGTTKHPLRKKSRWTSNFSRFKDLMLTEGGSLKSLEWGVPAKESSSPFNQRSKQLVEPPLDTITLRRVISTNVWMMGSGIFLHLALRKRLSFFTSFGRLLHPLIR